MAPSSWMALAPRHRADFNLTTSSTAFHNQWALPGDIFSVLLILGGDVMSRSLAQLAGTPLTPVAFSFGTLEL
jgi:hypothetical protein